jgi:flavorubredoxin
MPVTNTQSGTRVDEIAENIFRISTPVPPNPGLPAGFTFNQFLVVDDEPLLFHTGMRALFPLVKEAVASVMAPEKLRWISFGHHEADEDGSLDEWMAVAKNAQPVVGKIGSMLANVPARGLADGEVLAIGKKKVRWIDTPHVPHGWDAGLLFEVTTHTLFGGDLFTQPGNAHDPVTSGDILGPSEAMRAAMEYFSNRTTAVATIDRIAKMEPRLIACMHGASYRGDGAAALRALVAELAK